MGLFSDLKGTTVTSFLLGLTGVRLKDSSGNLIIRNNGDSADAEVTTSKVNISGDNFVINSDAAGSGNDWAFTFSRSSSQTQAVTLTLPVDDGAASQVLQTDGSGVLSWVSAGSTADLVHVNSTTLSFGDSSPLAMFSLPASAIIHKVRVIVDTAFDGTAPTMSVGISGTTSKYMATSQVDLKGTAEDIYESNPGKAAAGGESLIITYVPDSSTVGSARVEVHYSNPS